jgi:RAB6A-GEF complex partner protein 1
LVLVAIEFDSASHAYQVPSSIAASAAAHNFLPGPGEAFPIQTAHLHFEGVIRIEGHLLRSDLIFSTTVALWFTNLILQKSVSPRRQYILYSTKRPSAIHRISWPAVDDSSQDEIAPGPYQGKAHIGYDSWALDDEELPWLLEEDGKGSQLVAYFDSWSQLNYPNSTLDTRIIF